jgi:hypothetical protein
MCVFFQSFLSSLVSPRLHTCVRAVRKVFPSGFTILVDVPEINWNSGKVAEQVANKLAAILGGKKHINVGVASHLHLDHIGYAGYGGWWALLEKHGFSVDRFIDRDSGVWKDADGDGTCAENEIKWHNIGTLSGTGTAWVCYATSPNSNKIYPVRQIAKLCSTTQLAPPDADAAVTIVAVDAATTYMADGKTLVGGDHHAESYPPSENDYSVGFVVRYKQFSYGFFSDLDGEYTKVCPRVLLSPSLVLCCWFSHALSSRVPMDMCTMTLKRLWSSVCRRLMCTT